MIFWKSKFSMACSAWWWINRVWVKTVLKTWEGQNQTNGLTLKLSWPEKRNLQGSFLKLVGKMLRRDQSISFGFADQVLWSQEKHFNIMENWSTLLDRCTAVIQLSLLGCDYSLEFKLPGCICPTFLPSWVYTAKGYFLLIYTDLCNRLCWRRLDAHKYLKIFSNLLHGTFWGTKIWLALNNLSI